jgi:hypothetical protein
MALHIDYFVRIYNLPHNFVATNQIRIHLMLVLGERTWEKTSKDVGVIANDDKRLVVPWVGMSHGFHFTMATDHLSRIESMQGFVYFIVVPYLDNEVQMMVRTNALAHYVLECAYQCSI